MAEIKEISSLKIAPSQDLISMLEEELERAKNGEIIEAAVTTRDKANFYTTTYSGTISDVYAMLGALQASVFTYYHREIHPRRRDSYE